MSSLNLNLKQIESILKPKLSKNCLKTKSMYENNILNREIEEIWHKIIFSFDYQKFYLHNNQINGKTKTANRVEAMREYQLFLNKHKIILTDDFNLSCKMEGEKILNSFKIWTMLIIIMSQTLHFSDTMKLFTNALINKVDSHELFEFFLIFISTYDINYFKNYLKNFEYNMSKWPDEFRKIYWSNKEDLFSIFNSKDKVHELTEIFHNVETEIYSFEDFSFCKEDKIQSFIQDLDNYNEEKLKSLMQDEQIFIPGIFNEDLINNQNLIEKSPDNLGGAIEKSKFSKGYKSNSKSPLFFNKSPTLDSYLLPNNDNGAQNQNLTDTEIDEIFPSSNINFNLENALKNLEEKEKRQGECEEESSNLSYRTIEKLENDEIQTTNSEKTSLVQEEFYNDDNLLLIDSNFKNNNNFAIFYITNNLLKLFQHHSDSPNSILYMITPIKIFSTPQDRREVEKDMKDIVHSAYKNFVYFPFNTKLRNLLDQMEIEN